MSTVIDEGRIRFEFGASWRVEKYDDHPDYRNGIQKLKHPAPGQGNDTTAVDFVGVVGKSLILIEVKDFRGHQIDTKKRVGEELAAEVAFKVRDSVAGIIGAHRKSNTPETWEPFAAALASRTKEVQIVLWLDQDRSSDHCRNETATNNDATCWPNSLKNSVDGLRRAHSLSAWPNITTCCRTWQYRNSPERRAARTPPEFPHDRAARYLAATTTRNPTPSVARAAALLRRRAAHRHWDERLDQEPPR